LFFRVTPFPDGLITKYFIGGYRWGGMSYTISRPRILEIIEKYQAAAASSRVRYPELLEEIRELLSMETADG